MTQPDLESKRFICRVGEAATCLVGSCCLGLAGVITAGIAGEATHGASEVSDAAIRGDMLSVVVGVGALTYSRSLGRRADTVDAEILRRESPR